MVADFPGFFQGGKTVASGDLAELLAACNPPTAAEGNPVMEWIAEATDSLSQVPQVREMPIRDLLEWLIWKRKQRKNHSEFEASLAGKKLK